MGRNGVVRHCSKLEKYSTVIKTLTASHLQSLIVYRFGPQEGKLNLNVKNRSSLLALNTFQVDYTNKICST
jgi:hypothetical protein